MKYYWGVSVALLLLCVALGARAQQSLSEEEIEELLNAHNYYRSLVDPIATDMLKLVRIATPCLLKFCQVKVWGIPSVASTPMHLLCAYFVLPMHSLGKKM